MRRSWWLGVAVALAVLLGVTLAIPTWAASSRQANGPESDGYAAMHEACEAGDVQGMTEAMDVLTDEDWEAMEEHMSDGHHETMDSSMMGMGGMMGGWSGSSSGWSSMMSW